MRKIVLSLFCLCMLSCSSDDDANVDNTPAIIGTWVISQFNVENDTFDLNNDGTESNNLVSESGCYQGETMIFNANGTGSITYTTDLELTLTNSNNVETFSFECLLDNSSYNFTWIQLENGTIVADNNGDPTTITMLSNNTISRSTFFEYPIVFVDANGDVISTSYSESDATNVYVKQ